MYDSNSRGISYSAGFFILIGFTIAGILAAGLLSIPVWTSLTGTSFETMTTDMNNPAYADAYKVIQVIAAIVGFFLPAVLAAYLLNRKPMKLIGFSGKIQGMQLLLVIMIVFFGLMVSTSLSWFNSNLPIPNEWKTYFDKMEADYNDGVESVISLRNFADYLFALFILAVLPAICEETLFRGGLQNFLTRSTKMPWLSIILVSILFSLAHWSYYGFLSRLFLGMMLGLLYQYSGRIWLSIFGHFLNNAIAISVLYFYTMNGKSLKEAINDETETFWGIFALPVMIALFVWYYKISQKNQNPVPVPPIPNSPQNFLS